MAQAADALEQVLQSWVFLKGELESFRAVMIFLAIMGSAVFSSYMKPKPSQYVNCYIDLGSLPWEWICILPVDNLTSSKSDKAWSIT